MKFLVATDFSERSNLAIQRAALLGKALHASAISLLHVIDADQPDLLVSAMRPVTDELLEKDTKYFEKLANRVCEWGSVSGDPAGSIVLAARKQDADLVVIGSHRQDALRDLFTGTTAERIIRTNSRPTLMVNGNAARPYRQVLVAVDFSVCSGDALEAVRKLGLARIASLAVLHVFDTPAAGALGLSSPSKDQIEAYLLDEHKGASQELSAFLERMNFTSAERILKRSALSVAQSVVEAAREISADLIVIGTRGRSGVIKTLLGSVAESILQMSDCDVLAVPPSKRDKDAGTVPPRDNGMQSGSGSS